MIKENHAVAELQWNSGAAFCIVPRKDEHDQRYAVIKAFGCDGEEVKLRVDLNSLNAMAEDLLELICWVKERPAILPEG